MNPRSVDALLVGIFVMAVSCTLQLDELRKLSLSTHHSFAAGDSGLRCGRTLRLVGLLNEMVVLRSGCLGLVSFVDHGAWMCFEVVR